jgi:hypothetical protein
MIRIDMLCSFIANRRVAWLRLHLSRREADTGRDG